MSYSPLHVVSKLCVRIETRAYVSWEVTCLYTMHLMWIRQLATPEP